MVYEVYNTLQSCSVAFAARALWSSRLTVSGERSLFGCYQTLECI